MKQLLMVVMAAMVPIIPSTYNLSEITSALSSGNVDRLDNYFENQVSITLFNKTNLYSKEKAVDLLKNFFNDFPPTGFRQMHQGVSKGEDSQFCIGNLATSGKTFRVYIFMRVVGDKSYIKELRFNEE